ncbi:hypothetical protein Q1695_014212 [Nippostrongylus brasiliensis]|nr:hypothetical protein Q1695_014212 [Nippostrongylus brasiliensis]
MKIHVNRWRTYTSVVFAIGALYCIAEFLQTPSPRLSDDDVVLTNREFFHLLNATYGTLRLMESVRNDDGSKVDVRDSLRYRDGKYYVVREAAVEVGTETVVLLKTPQKLTGANLDTARWEVDRTYLPTNSYYHIVVRKLLENLPTPLTKDSKASVLIIGLGGGTINNFLHHTFPQMNITVIEYSRQMFEMASKWFGLQMDEHQRVKIADGVVFIDEKAKQGEQYDVVLLDACDFEYDKRIICPHQSFLKNEVIGNMAKLIGESGFLLVNVVSVAIRREVVENMLMPRFSPFFKVCEMERVLGSVNTVLSCSHGRLNPARPEVFEAVQVTLL